MTGEGLIWAFDTAHDGQFQDRIVFGRPGDDLVVGDWNGDDIDDLAVSRPGETVAPGGENPGAELDWSFLPAKTDLSQSS